MQEEISDVIHVSPENEIEYMDFTNIFRTKDVDWNELIGIEGEVIQTHVGDDYISEHPEQINRPTSMIFDNEFKFIDDNFKGAHRSHCNKRWCKYGDEDCPVFNPNNRKNLMFQPYSTESASPLYHWPFWFNALEYISATDRWNIYVFGQKQGGMRGKGFEFPNLDHLKNVYDIVGKTKSALDLFNAAEQCDGVLTTSNCLSMWTAVSDKPTMVVCNKLNMGHAYYNGWISTPPNTVLKYNMTLERFEKEFESWEKSL
jgi:hypothetical protein